MTVCGEEKVVCGVTKHTTCSDMVQALLEDHKSIPESKRQLHGDPKDFCLVERWKGFERVLPPLTRILRLWCAWGDQRPFVQFLLFKTSDFVSAPTKKSVKSKGAKPKRYDYNRVQFPQSLPVEKQKRVVRKAFRKLEKLHKENKSTPGSEEIDRMVQLILHQDHTIREQIQRMRNLDLEIERIEVHCQQEDLEGQACGGWSLDMEEQLNQFLYTSDGVEQLEAQVQKHQELILKLSKEIDEELRREMSGKSEQEGSNVRDFWSDESVCAAELESLQTELKHGLFAGVSLQNQVSEIDKQLKYFDAALITKDEECWQLAAQLNSLQITDLSEENPGSTVSLQSQPCSVLQTMKLKDSLTPLDVTDTDSDTGISSTHSQDSLSPGLDFPPPLDTDV